MNLREWYSVRGPGYAGQRGLTLLGRYGVTASKAVDRVTDCVAALASQGCSPTFPIPARVVQKYPDFFRSLQGAGAEIAVHGYDHVDLRNYPTQEACDQLVIAAGVLAQLGIESCGFRCPYLSCTDAILDALPDGIFEYSSNQAIAWDGVSTQLAHNGNATASNVLDRLYDPTSALETVCTPRVRSSVVEVPVCLPDDLQLHDALGLGPEGIAEAWGEILRNTHRRGELFGLMFHPELASVCWLPFTMILQEAARLRPAVWVARLRDISSWWREKAGFSVSVSPSGTGFRISFSCSERATILVKGLEVGHSARFWDGTYHQLESRELSVPSDLLPFVGLPGHTPERIVTFLQEQGYILDTGNTAERCATVVDSKTLDELISEVELVNFIETSPGPLVRYWRWPNGAKSCLSISGDLDALSLADYAVRLWGG